MTITKGQQHKHQEQYQRKQYKNKK